MPNYHLLRQELEKFKESSKEAVIDGNQDLKGKGKKYFHIEREVERELKIILRQAYVSDKPQLILICGNVGDGKSHLLSRLYSEMPEEMKAFQVHNDATESDSPNRTYLQTLEDKFKDFKDANLKLDKNSKSKFLLAINLGTLANFIDAEESNEFEKLKEFVDRKGILKQEVQNNSFDNSHNFQYINFTDYHFYSLKEEGTVSELIGELIDKVATPDNQANPIYIAYQKTISQEGFPKKLCPIVRNYELLLNEPLVKAKIEQLLIEITIKHKHILSLRALLNFVFDLLVPAEFASLNDNQLIKRIEQYNEGDEEFINSLLINYIFEHPTVSPSFKHLAKLDPASYRSENLDYLLINLINAEELRNEVAKYIDSSSYAFSMIEELLALPYKKIRGILEKTFLRTLFFVSPLSREYFKDEPFDEYTKLLFHFNQLNYKKLAPLYKKVKEAIYKWNGKARGLSSGDLINTFIGQQQNKYRISAELSLTSKPKDVKIVIGNNSATEVIHKFLQYIRVAFSSQGKSREINIDFSLYKLIKKINKGYRPNQFDKEDFISFSLFIDDLINDALDTKDLFFRESNHSTHRIFSLTYDEFGLFKFEEKVLE